MSIHGFFISFTKRELKICVLLGTLEITSLSGVTVFLIKLIDLEAFFLTDLTPGACIEGTCTRDIYTSGTCSGGTYIGAGSTGVACTGSSYTMGACTKGAYTKSTCFRGIGTRDTCTGDTCARSACIKDDGPDSIGTEGSNMKSACTGGAGVVEHLRIYLQSFLISEMGGAGLEI